MKQGNITMKATTTMYLRARNGNSYSDDYDESIPYEFEMALSDHESEYSWVVGSFEVICPLDMPSRDHVIACQVKGLEKVLADHVAESYAQRIHLEQKIQDLLAIEDMSDA
jgi:hypothetical protein